MKKTSLALALALAALTGAGCYGPMKLTRSVDDWGNQTYTDNPWVGQPVGWIVIPVGMAVCGVADVVVLNPIQFFGTDAWEGRGTPYVHKAVSGGHRSTRPTSGYRR